MKFNATVLCFTDKDGIISTNNEVNYITSNNLLIKRVLQNIEEISDNVYCIKNEAVTLNSFSNGLNSEQFYDSIELLIKEFTECKEEQNLLFLEANQPLITKRELEQLLNIVNENNKKVASLITGDGKGDLSGIHAIALSLFSFKNIASRLDITQPFIKQIATMLNSNLCNSYHTLGTPHVTVIDEFSYTSFQAIERASLVRKWQEQGVVFEDASTVQIDSSVVLKPGCVIGAFTILRGKTIVDSGTKIQAFSALENTIIGKNANIMSSTIVDSIIEDEVCVGPYAYIRGKSIIKSTAQIGAYSEINDTIMGEGSKCKHVSYIGHTQVGSKANIGAGTITCTFDGVKKYKSSIGDNAFVGSGTLLVAPINIGNNSMTGAGSVLTRDVLENQLVYGVPAKVIRDIKK